MQFRMKAAIAAALMALAIGPAAQSAWSFNPAPDMIRAHMAYLASDELQGRDAGMPGYDAAAAYVAGQFRDMGLTPGGVDGSFLQPLVLIRHRTTAEGSVRLIGRGGSTQLRRGVDFRNSTLPHGRDVSLRARAVFAGYGIVDPALGRDDFAGLDVKGRIAVVFDGAPPTVPAEDRRFVSSARAKAQMAEKHGAVGLIVITRGELPPETESGRRWSWTWERPDGDAAYEGVPVLAELSPAGAAKLFANADKDLVTRLLNIAADDPDPPRFTLPVTIDASSGGELGERRKSENVIAVIEGADPALKDQYIIMSGHLDHIGVLDRPVDGDAINNGALDNAAGIATLIEGARGFAQGPRPRRSVIFLAVTGEEKGLIGSSYFVNNPTVPKAQIVADVNLDMPVMTYDFIDVAAIGAEHSTIVEAVGRAAAKMDVGLSPDPVPELGIFTRSDHFNFVQQGIPAVFLIGGFKNGGGEKFHDFYDHRYHRPGDDLNQDIDYVAGAKWSRLNYEIAWELATQDPRPVWNRNDLFGARFAAPGTLPPNCSWPCAPPQ